MKKVVYFNVEDSERDFLIKENEGKYDYKLINHSLSKLTDIDEEIRQAEIISCFTTSRVTGEQLQMFPYLKLIALRSVGFNHIDLDYCNSKGIVVENTPNYGNKSVAEFAFGLMLDVCRKISKAYDEYKEMMVCPTCTMGYELGGKTIGIVGLGAIGSEFARLAYGFDMKILGYDITQNPNLVELYKVKYVDFDTLLSQSDFISLHSPLTKDNHHMFDEKAFKKMRENAIIINTARGELIDTQAIFNALNKKEILGAGLDVLESEETISNPDYLIDINRLNENVLKQTILNTRLLQLGNVIVTPHMAYNTHEAIQRILDTTMQNINYFNEGIVQHNVN